MNQVEIREVLEDLVEAYGKLRRYIKEKDPNSSFVGITGEEITDIENTLEHVESLNGKSKSMCAGCRDNYYNQNVKGGCWCFADAKVVTKVQVGTWQPPPYERLPIKVLSCYHATGYSFLSLDDCRIKGENQ